MELLLFIAPKICYYYVLFIDKLVKKLIFPNCFGELIYTIKYN